MFSTFVVIFGTDRAGMAGLLLVLAAGFLTMLALRVPGNSAR
jgi:UMF1 family MFS transporter